MAISASARQWMHALARLRGQLVRMRANPSTTASDALDVADEALQLIDTLRAELSASEKRCVTLQAEMGEHAREAQVLLQVVPTPIVVTDPQGRIEDANRAAAELLGRSTARLKEELLLHFFDDREAFFRLVHELASTPSVERTTLKLRPRERAPFESDITLVPDPRQGPTRWLWFLGRSTARRTPARTIVLPTNGRPPHHPDAA